MNRKIALIFGVSGQDGAFLANFLLSKGYQVHGTSRDSREASFLSLDILSIKSKITLHSLCLSDFNSVLRMISEVSPDEIYNLSGQTSVAESFLSPQSTMDSILTATQNILEAIRIISSEIRFYNAASSECFGDSGSEPANERTSFNPKSPYGVAKSEAFCLVAKYRQVHFLRACSGILFNHESSLRPERFVTRKVSIAAANIAVGNADGLVLGDLSIKRDWGWAPEYVPTMWAMLQRDVSEDFVIATGRSTSLRSFVENAFSAVDLDWKRYVVEDQDIFRPSEIRYGRGDPTKAANLLGWSAAITVESIATRMVQVELRRIKGVPARELLV
jgi:GDPmannose 4,6-dehydratase